MLIFTHTADPSGVEFKVRGAVTVVAPRDVDTHTVNTNGWVGTFINICANQRETWLVSMHKTDRKKPFWHFRSFRSLIFILYM